MAYSPASLYALRHGNIDKAFLKSAARRGTSLFPMMVWFIINLRRFFKPFHYFGAFYISRADHFLASSSLRAHVSRAARFNYCFILAVARRMFMLRRYHQSGAVCRQSLCRAIPARSWSISMHHYRLDEAYQYSFRFWGTYDFLGAWDFLRLGIIFSIYCLPQLCLNLRAQIQELAMGKATFTAAGSRIVIISAWWRRLPAGDWQNMMRVLLWSVNIIRCLRCL